MSVENQQRDDRLVRMNPVSFTVLLLAVLILSFCMQSTSSADVYQYVDENEVVHLTNVPGGGRYKVLIRERKVPAPVVSAPAAVLAAPYGALISSAADKYGVDRALVTAVIKAESNFDSQAISSKGARGLMQLMPRTAEILGVRDCFHPGENIEGGIRYLAYLISLYQGDLRLALAAYNAGEGAVARYGGIPPYTETRTYIRRVLDHYQHYRNTLSHSGDV